MPKGNCPQCGLALTVPEHRVGKPDSCPRCGARYVAKTTTELGHIPQPPRQDLPQQQINVSPYPSTDALRAYYDKLVELQGKAQESYDKTLTWLLGGALALSFSLASDFRPPKHGLALKSAWVLWVLGLLLILASCVTSLLATSRALRAVCRDKTMDGDVAGPWNTWTVVLGGAAGLLFAIGLMLFAVFIIGNVG